MPVNGDVETPHIATISKRSPYGALFTRTLPHYGGEYRVGVRDVEIPVPRQSFGNFKHKSILAEAGITIDTVMFTLFYPTDSEGNDHQIVWFPRLTVYVGAAVAIWGTTFPGIKNAPLKVLPGSQKWPLLLFSHGAGSSRLMNSSFCGEMASRGYVVAAIEHRDGTGPSARIVDQHGETRDLAWIDWSDLDWTGLPEQPQDDNMLRHVQLEVRLAEVQGVLAGLRRAALQEPLIVTGLGSSLPCNWDGWHCVKVEEPIIAGHSFGGSLAMAAAADGRLRFSHVVVFDPATQSLWLEPWNKHISAPLLAVNSQEFASGAEFPMLRSMTSDMTEHELYVIPGSSHPSFSDVCLILPDCINKMLGLTNDPVHIINVTVDTTRRFLERREMRTDHIIK
ncbi:hypothetical protein ID866_7554, partial [Astraeus odoratus]